MTSRYSFRTKPVEADYLRKMSDPELRKKLAEEDRQAYNAIRDKLRNERHVERCWEKLFEVQNNILSHYPKNEYVVCEGELGNLKRAFEKHGYKVKPVVIKSKVWFLEDTPGAKISWET